MKALIYFEVVSTMALVIGLIVGWVVKPGAGFNIDPATLDPKIAAGDLAKAHEGEGMVAYLLHLIPDTFVGAFAEGNLLQVLVIAILTGFACTRLGVFGERWPVGWRAWPGCSSASSTWGCGLRRWAPAASRGQGSSPSRRPWPSWPTIPIADLAVLVGFDRFMSECRALTNLVGNGVATVVVARWDGALDRDQLSRELQREPTSTAAQVDGKASAD